MLGAVATMMAAAGLLAVWKDLPGLLIGRLLTGVSVGLAAGTAIVYLIELRVRADPKASVVRARTIGTSVNVGALGIGPLVAGCLAQWAPWPLTLPYLAFVALGAVALIGLATAPETGAPAPRDTSGKQPTGSRRSVRLPVPAAAATLAAFAANGLFAGLSGLLLATTFDNPSHAGHVTKAAKVLAEAGFTQPTGTPLLRKTPGTALHRPARPAGNSGAPTSAVPADRSWRRRMSTYGAAAAWLPCRSGRVDPGRRPRVVPSPGTRPKVLTRPRSSQSPGSAPGLAVHCECRAARMRSQ